MAKTAKRYYKVDPWIIEETGFDPSRSKCSESIFALANEFMGVRGYFEEGYSGDSMQGAYFNGIYERGKHQYSTKFKGFAEEWTFMVNSVDWLKCEIIWDGIRLDLNKVKFRDFVRRVDMRKGVLERSFVWIAPDGRELKLSFERFLSMSDSRLAAQRLSFEALNFSGFVELALLMDWDTLYQLRGSHPWNMLRSEHNGKIVSSLGRTASSGHRVFAAFRLEGDLDAVPCSSAKSCGFRGTLSLKKDCPKTVTRIFSFHSEKDLSLSDSQVWDEGIRGAKQRFSKLDWDSAESAHRAYWDDVWKHLDIVIEGDDENQQGFRYCLFHLHQTYHGADSRFNVGAKGLTGEHYWGVAWWDTETYCLPFYLFNNRAAARNLISYRYRTLPGALARAKELHLDGARYPMCTIDGEEICDVWQHGDLEIHVSAAVAYGVWKYHHITKDDEFLFSQGVEILVQVARFYASRGGWGQKTGRYGFWGVMGPDEMHMMVNNNAYTNFMAAKSFKFALDTLARMSRELPSEYDALTERLHIQPEELDDWSKKAACMETMLDAHTGIYEQHEGFFNLPHIDYQHIPDDQFPVQKKWPYVDLFRFDLIKQPDVLLFMFLFGTEFSDESLKVNMDYYEPRCSHESSLSPAIHSILAARLGRLDQAYEYARYASRLDLDDYNNNTYEGLHVTSMAGTWMNLVYGFGGMQSDGPILRFRPSIPSGWNKFSFRLLVQDDAILRVSITPDNASFKLDGSGKPIEIEVFDQKVVVGQDGISIPMPPDRVGTRSTPVKAVIFDLDGVVVSTDECHYLGWKRLAEEEGIPFTREDNMRQRGVSRMESLEILLEKASREYSPEEKRLMAERKNSYYCKLLETITPKDTLPGARELIAELKKRGIKVAIGSSSKNTPIILQRIGMDKEFDAVADGNDIRKSKPHPEVFLKAAEKLGVPPRNCLVVEDAEAGVEAAIAAGMKCLAVGTASHDKRAHIHAKDLTEISADKILESFKNN